MQDQRNDNDENLANQMGEESTFSPSSYPSAGVGEAGLTQGLPQLTCPPPNQTLNHGSGTAYPPQYQVEQNFQLTDGTNHCHGSYHYNAQGPEALSAAPLTTDLYHGNGLPAQTGPNGVIQTPGLNYSNTGNSVPPLAAPLPVNIGYGNSPLAQTGSYGVGHSLGSYHYDSQNLGALSAAPLATDIGYGNGLTAPNGPDGITQFSGLSYLNSPGFGAFSSTSLLTNLDYGNGPMAQTYPNDAFQGVQSFWNPGMQPLGMVPVMTGTLSSNGMAVGGYEAPSILPTAPFLTAQSHGGIYTDNYNPMVQGTTGLADWNPLGQPPVDTSSIPNYGTNFTTRAPVASTAPAVAGNGRFPCTQPNCNKTFGRNYELTRHEGSVHGINTGTHLCPIFGCPRSQGRQFSRADKVKEHLWKAHGNLGHVKRV